MAYGHGAPTDGDGLRQVGEGSVGFLSRFEGRRPSDRKTVTFGDSSAVRSLPFWSAVSLVALLFFWYVSTKAWGMPEAFLDPDLTEAILDRGIEASEAARHCRGWWGAASGPAQAAERAVFASVGWEWESFEREVVELAVGHEHWIYRVAGGEVDVDVAVSVNRHLPTIACRADGGLPAKPAMEYSAKIL